MAKKQSMGSNIGTWFEMGKATGADMPTSAIDLKAMESAWKMGMGGPGAQQRTEKKNKVKDGTKRAQENAKNNPDGEIIVKAGPL